jgi:hypothetical protein
MKPPRRRAAQRPQPPDDAVIWSGHWNSLERAMPRQHRDEDENPARDNAVRALEDALDLID